MQSAIAVHESQTAFNEPEIACSMAYVRSKFGWIPDSIKKLETTGLSLQESMDILENAEVKLGAVRG
jgi:Zn-dependent M32 family carboxypeptidase